ncbi:pseudouridine synthase [Novosphingobium sp. Leaf2]|uniref:pseudouridine synthase n=1 Tax=Novosphingobium sp. Leaf2 TaxID=1735670 RepID=UPI0006F9A9BA|nr:pseudouridine synthase [Novosphingobium sp. Leaf2]KQM18822.1 pseudouridine synthase [Novosphingobium sp. Leaf2]
MSKPPSKSGGRSGGNFNGTSGGSGRGRRPGGTPRDGSSFVDGPRGPARSGPRSAGPRSADTRDGAPRSGKPYGDRPREDRPRSDKPRGNRPYGDRPQGDRPQRGERPGTREGSREGGLRASAGERERDTAPRDDRPRSDTTRGSYNSAGSNARGPRGRDERPYGARNDRYTPRDQRYGGGSGRGRADAPRPVHKPGPAPRAAAPTPKDPTLPAREGERIAKLLARAGIASRREVERIIIEGRVKLGDQVIETPSTVLTSLAGVTVDGNPVQEPEGTRLFLFHKPAGLITAERDPAGRPTIYAALRNALPEGTGRVMPIGRLDLSTEGLLLLTNDGEFKRQLELPATGVPRTYRARTFGDITQGRLEDLMEGIEVDGVIYGKINANMERRTGRNQWIEMTLTEGKNREVRRVLEALDLQVSRLIRVSYGPFLLGDLPKGAAGEVAQRDLDNFRRTLPALKNADRGATGEPEA